MLTLPASVRVFVARGATDLRRSFDRLSALKIHARRWLIRCFFSNVATGGTSQ
jgi:hypothetical protein